MFRTLVQYRITSVSMTRTMPWTNDTTNLQTLPFKWAFGGEQ